MKMLSDNNDDGVTIGDIEDYDDDMSVSHLDPLDLDPPGVGGLVQGRLHPVGDLLPGAGVHEPGSMIQDQGEPRIKDQKSRRRGPRESMIERDEPL